MKTLSDSEHDQDVTLCDWRDVSARLALLDRPENTVYGVPPGGMIAAGFLSAATNVPGPTDATVILVDVIRSEEHRAVLHKQFPCQEIKSLFDQTATDRKRGWLVMPWESQEQECQPPVDPARAGLTDEEWEAWQALDKAVDLAMGLPWPNLTLCEAFYHHAISARAVLSALPAERAFPPTLA